MTKYIIPDKWHVTFTGQSEVPESAVGLNYEQLKYAYRVVGSISGATILLKPHTGHYDGRYRLGFPSIRLDVPGASAEADKVVVLYILLHELAHHKQHTNMPYEQIATLDRKCQSEPGSPIEMAANKYAIRMITSLGLPPHAVRAHLIAALGGNAKYLTGAWPAKYLRGITPPEGRA